VERIVQFGISSHLYHAYPLSQAHLVELAKYGFRRLELFAARGHFDYHDPAAVENLGRWLEAAGMVLHSVHAPIVESIVGRRWGAAYSTATTDAAARERAVQEALAAIAIARTVPYGCLVLHLGLADMQNPGANDNSREPAKRSVEQIHEAAEAAGVRVALEVIPNRLSSPESLVEMIEDELDLPGIGICLDFGHAFLMGDLADAIETTSGHLVTTHVHDNRGKSDDHLTPFEGHIDWDTALMTVQKVGYEGTLMLELQSQDPARAVLERAVAARRRFEQVLESDWVPGMSGA
jgi:sugar phosphate isomerase/epimerase